MDNKEEGNENKIILGEFYYTMDKMEQKGFIDAVPVMPSLWIMA